MDKKKLGLTYEEAAELVGGISVRTIRELVRNGDIGVKYIGRRPFIPVDELESWFAALPSEPPAR